MRVHRIVYIAVLVVFIAATCLFFFRSTGTPVSPAASARVKILIDWKADTTYAGFFIARERGYYAKRNLDVEIVEGTGAMTTAQVIGSRTDYFIGSCSGEATVIARSKGVPIRSAAVLYREVPTVLYSRAENPIRNPRDLIGKRIGLVDGSIGVQEFYACLAANGIDSKQVEILSSGKDPATVLSGRLDAQESYEEAEALQLSLQGHKIAIMRFADYGVHAYSLNIVVNEAGMEPRAREIKDIVEASIEGYEFLRSNPSEAAGIYHRLFPQHSEPFISESIKVVAKNLGTGPIGPQTQKGWNDTIDMLYRLRVIERKPSVSELVVPGFLEDVGPK